MRAHTYTRPIPTPHIHNLTKIWQLLLVSKPRLDQQFLDGTMNSIGVDKAFGDETWTCCPVAAVTTDVGQMRNVLGIKSTATGLITYKTPGIRKLCAGRILSCSDR